MLLCVEEVNDTCRASLVQAGEVVVLVVLSLEIVLITLE